MASTREPGGSRRNEMRKLHVQQTNKLSKVDVVYLIYARTYNGVRMIEWIRRDDSRSIASC
jgi:hypothetical protein